MLKVAYGHLHTKLTATSTKRNPFPASKKMAYHSQGKAFVLSVYRS